MCQYSIESAVSLPDIEPIVNALYGAVAFRPVTPDCSGAKYPEYAVKRTPVVVSRHAGLTPGKQVLNESLLFVGKFVAPHHPPGSLETSYDTLSMQSSFQTHPSRGSNILFKKYGPTQKTYLPTRAKLFCNLTPSLIPRIRFYTVAPSFNQRRYRYKARSG